MKTDYESEEEELSSVDIEQSKIIKKAIKEGLLEEDRGEHPETDSEEEARR